MSRMIDHTGTEWSPDVRCSQPSRVRRWRRSSRGLAATIVIALVPLLTSCEAFNPAFLSLVDSEGTGSIQSIPNAPGHIVLTVLNNAEIDERLLTFLESRLTLSDAEKRSLRPRIRMRIRVTFADGTFQTIEFITGSANLVDPAFDAQAVPDLNQNDLSNAVVVCDVASVQIEPGSVIEVFVPVELTGFELIEIAGQGGNTVGTTFQPRRRDQPQFQPLQVDDIDPDSNVILRRNIGIRDVPSPVTNVTCGSVIPIVINGVLSVPFSITDEPSYDIADQNTIATIGGRYEFLVSVQ